MINLVESGGADLPTQTEIFIPGGQIFRDLTRLSALGIPTIALVFGNSTAGGAYVPGMCDYVVMVDRQAKVFLGGPPLVKMATGEESDDESLGGAEMHARISGLADYFAVDEHDAIRIGRRIVAELNWRKLGPPPGPARRPSRCYDPDELLGIVPADLRVPFDPREVIARVVDGSRVRRVQAALRHQPGHRLGRAARLPGRHPGQRPRACCSARSRRRRREFIQLANQTDTPLLFLQNTTGYMVGAELRAGRASSSTARR